MARKKTAPPARRSITNAVLADDGYPVFADGMSRRQWLAATADDRKAKLVADLKADAESGAVDDG